MRWFHVIFAKIWWELISAISTLWAAAMIIFYALILI